MRALLGAQIWKLKMFMVPPPCLIMGASIGV
ncbi:unnamed protein product [Ectocarpus sp. CCAP 1310/34]|nr:unnamed protein product [Ectocarpus sp. CCAP 1310/34]